MTNNNTNSNVSVVELKVRPYDSSSKIAHEKPGLELFDDRSDFMLLAHQRYVAASFSVVNENVFGATARGQQVALTVWLFDRSTGEALASKSLGFRFKPEEIYKTFRVDMMLEYVAVDSDHVYEVQVCDSGNGQVLERKSLRFYDMPRIKKLPTKWFRAIDGFAYSALDEDRIPMRGFSDLGSGGVGVKFHINCDLIFDRDQMPEIEFRLTAPDGTVKSDYCRPQWDESPAHKDAMAVCQTFAVSPDKTGVYYMELRCMGYPFAGAVFKVGGKQLGGLWRNSQLDYISCYNCEKGEERWNTYSEQNRNDMEGDDFDRVLADFMDAEPKPVRVEEPDVDDLIGLTSVKTKLSEYTQLMRLSRLREQCGLPALSTPLHAMFLGSPGTGKTTVAKIIGKRLRDIGVLSKGHVVVRERSTLLGQYYSSESEKTLKALEEAKGGILFIDEAYQLHQPEDPKDPGRFVIETLMTALADESNRDWMLILAGYSGPMQAMFALNPGLR
ncbi:MAG: AAA family ATPase, partial [Muribaculaceae bacterium]|nr:AAA family ATPase [Muribaculaceae bacterium]